MGLSAGAPIIFASERSPLCGYVLLPVIYGPPTGSPDRIGVLTDRSERSGPLSARASLLDAPKESVLQVIYVTKISGGFAVRATGAATLSAASGVTAFSFPSSRRQDVVTFGFNKPLLAASMVRLVLFNRLAQPHATRRTPAAATLV